MRKVLDHYPGAAGADEAGRGPLAGPVVAAAVILPDDFDRTDVVDSKQIPAALRETLEIRIKASAIWVVEISWTEEVDRLNILHASLIAMRRAVDRLIPAPCELLVDGNQLPPGLRVPARAVVKGDQKVACIAAASILAKTERDRIMRSMAVDYPDYGFERHFGYPTPDHIAALNRLGPCAIHRRSFRTVRDLLQAALEFDGG